MKNRIRQALFYLLFLLITSINLEVNAQQTAQFQTYNVVWDTPSKDASESMPVGGGDIGCMGGKRRYIALYAAQWLL